MQIAELLDDFSRNRWDSRPFERLVDLVSADPSEADRFAGLALSQVPEGGTFFDLTLSFVTAEAFERLVETALRGVASLPRARAAEAVLAYASLQFPELLHGRLHELFRLRPNRGTYYENWPWRASGDKELSRLVGIVESRGTSAEPRQKAWRCLLESRFGPALDAAEALAGSLELGNPSSDYFREVGFDGPRRALYHPAVHHLVFEPGFFTATRPVWMNRAFHPTWSLAGQAIDCRFGGETDARCGLCRGALHHLLSLPRSLVDPEGVCEAPLVLATCLSCLGWEQPSLSYVHEGKQPPIALERGSVMPQFPAVALKEATARLTETPQRWSWQDWALSNSRENLSRVGGHPSWVQSADYPDCPSCAKPMRFLLQLDSDLPTEDGGEFGWGSGGICYGFWCGRCSVSTYLWQCT